MESCLLQKVEGKVKKGERSNMEEKEFALNDIVEMKKQHPCGVNKWKIIRIGDGYSY